MEEEGEEGGSLRLRYLRRYLVYRRWYKWTEETMRIAEKVWFG